MSDDFHPLIPCGNHRTQLPSATYATSYKSLCRRILTIVTEVSLLPRSFTKEDGAEAQLISTYPW